MNQPYESFQISDSIKAIVWFTLICPLPKLFLSPPYTYLLSWISVRGSFAVLGKYLSNQRRYWLFLVSLDDLLYCDKKARTNLCNFQFHNAPHIFLLQRSNIFCYAREKERKNDISELLHVHNFYLSTYQKISVRLRSINLSLNIPSKLPSPTFTAKFSPPPRSISST